LNSGAIVLNIVNFRQLSGLNFYLGCLILRFDTASVDCDNSPRPKAAIHYWRNRIGMGGWFGVEYAPTEQHVICFVQLTDF